MATSQDTIPPNDVEEFATHVASLTGNKPPDTLKKKRAFIANWYAEQAPPVLANTPRESWLAQAPPKTPPAADAYDAAPAPPDKDALLRDIAQYGAQIPSAALSSLAAAIESIEGTKAPQKLNQRRTFIEDWPLATLSTVCRHVGTVSKRKVPKLVAQKRNFVRGWHLDMRAQLGMGEGAGSGRAPALSEAELFDELERIFAEQNRRVTANSSELPNMIVDRLADQIARLAGAEPPTLQQERREMVYAWHKQEVRRRREERRSSGGQHGASAPH